ncbi:YhdP family protein [Histidinibacterium aquaticum]|uniref:DUF3971 domain-containing protein n=1 Tax=Histidinibacterium aquaticum TaxID=2613962 RepID=A0A5J5GL84_9RHOB|nr:DUF3971 domain-containing protein [Histidinibacterium aquaticum]KAA9008975.1 DUF3971 domain-containing protein [Histidinibacterium aquaticum]
MSGTGEGKDRAKRRGRKRRAAGRLAIALAGASVAFLVVVALSLPGREITAPSWVTEDVEARAEEMLGGGIDFRDITVTLGSDLHPRVALTEAVLSDAEGRVVARVPRIDALVSPRGLLLERQLLLQELVVTGAEVVLARDESGAVQVSFEAGGGPGAGGLADALDRPALAALEEVRAEALTLTYEDARSGRRWTVEDGDMRLSVTDEALEIAGDLEVPQAGGVPSTLAVDVSLPRGDGAAAFGIDLDGAPAADLAGQFAALSWLRVIDAPLSGNLRGTLGADGRPGEMDAVLRIGAGVVRASDETRPIPFDGARAYLSYAPATDEIAVDLLELSSEEAEIHASGRAYLRDLQNGRPGEIWGQFDIARASVNPGGRYADRLDLAEGAADLRLRFDPFRLDLGSATLALPGGARLQANGEARAGESGWRVALDLASERMTIADALGLWPEGWRPGVRGWFARNVTAGRVSDLSVSLRSEAGAAPIVAADFEISEGSVRFLQRMPELTGAEGFVQILDRSFALTLDAGEVEAPEGGTLDLAGSSMVIPVMGLPRTPAEFALKVAGPLPALLSVVDRPPLTLLSRANLPVALAEGEAEVSGRVVLPLGDGLTPDQVSYEMEATFRNVTSDELVPNRTLTAERVTLSASPGGLTVDGPVRVSGVPVEGSFSKTFEPGSPARVSGEVRLSPEALEAFGIGLPEGVVAGQGTGQLDLTLRRGAPPAFTLTSDLTGLRLRLPWVGWEKVPGTSGRLEIAGQLGETPHVDRLAAEAPGLRAEGRIDLETGGRFEAARFSRLSVGGWLDVPLVLRGRGAGQPVGVEVNGGTLDLRRARFGGGGGSGQGGPITAELDRLQITETLALTDFVGSFRPDGGLGGRFGARVNGGPSVEGALVPSEGRTAVRLTSEDGGGVLRAGGLLPNARQGSLDLRLQPTGSPGTFDGHLSIDDLRIQDAPAMAALLDAISVVGLLQQLDGQGLAFSEVDAWFRLTPDRITVTQASAVGPSLGLSLDGTYTQATKAMEFQGVISPFYLLNGIGSVLTRRGEGLIGFNFTLGGTPGDPQVRVNPLSALTPGMFREIFRRPAPEVGQ